MEKELETQIQNAALKAPDEVCESCGSITFTIAYILRKVSPMLTKELIPLQVWICTGCNEIKE